jgi:hypothetical protein
MAAVGFKINAAAQSKTKTATTPSPMRTTQDAQVRFIACSAPA